MANTGYVGYSTLEQYIISNGTATGVTKPNVNSDEDYISPVKNETVCPAQQRFYNAEIVVYGIKTDCPSGYTGSTVEFKVPANQFVSIVSQYDADTQALDYGNSVKENYANSLGSCSISYLVINSDNQLAFQTSSYNDACAITMATGNIYRLGGIEGTIQIGDSVFSNPSGGFADIGYYSFNLNGNRTWIHVQLSFGSGTTFVSDMGTCFGGDNFIRPDVNGNTVYFLASENVRSNILIYFIWQDDMGFINNSSVWIYEWQNYASWTLNNGRYLSSVEIQDVSPHSDGTYNYIF